MNEVIYEKYHTPLLKWCIKKTNNYNEAEDLVQEIYYQLLLSYSKDVIIVDEERFIWKLAYYTWCSRAKKYIKEKNIVGMTDAMEDVIRDDKIDITKKVEADEIKDILLKHINNLNDKTKKCVLLYYYEDLSVKEIAKELNIKENLVKYYLFQARKLLRSELENENI